MTNSTHITKKYRKKKNKVFQLNVCSFNAPSLPNKLQEIKVFTEVNAIQLLAVTETWLSTNIPDDSITLSGFQTPFRKDRDKIGGGLCIYASTELACKRREILETDGLEMIWVEVLNIMK